MEEGSKLGASVISKRFGAVLTRKRFSAEVGIHPKTLKKWEAAKVIEPRMDRIGGVATAVFDQSDVELGREVVKQLRSHPGTMSLADATENARRTLGS